MRSRIHRFLEHSIQISAHLLPTHLVRVKMITVDKLVDNKCKKLLYIFLCISKSSFKKKKVVKNIGQKKSLVLVNTVNNYIYSSAMKTKEGCFLKQKEKKEKIYISLF